MTLGPNSRIEQLLGEYGVGANSWVEDLYSSDTDRLLLALLLEQRGQDLVDALDEAQTEYDTQNRAVYWANNFTVTTNGPPNEVTDTQNRIDFGFQASSIDLRFTDDIRVRFATEGSDNADIFYRGDDKHASDIPVDTRYLYVERGPNASSNPTVFVEAWP